MSSIMRCRSGLMALSVMRDAPVLMKVANPSSQDRTAPPRYRVGWVARRSALPRERFSPLSHSGRRAVSYVRPLSLRELAPGPFCGPPYEPAAADNEYAQRNPPINPRGDDPNAQHDHRYDHRKIIRAGVAAVRAIATPRVQYARCAHPDEGDDPDHGANRYRKKQTGKNNCFRHPPRQQASVNTAKPVKRSLSPRVDHGLSRTAG